MISLKELQIKGFNTFPSNEMQKISLDSNMTLFFKPNDSGKTLIQDIIKNLFSDKPLDEELLTKYHNYNNNYSDSEFHIGFSSKISEQKISLKFHNNKSISILNNLIKREENFNRLSFMKEYRNIFSFSISFWNNITFSPQNSFVLQLNDIYYSNLFEEILGIDKYNNAIKFIESKWEKNEKKLSKLKSDLQELKIFFYYQNELKHLNIEYNQFEKKINDLNNEINLLSSIIFHVKELKKKKDEIKEKNNQIKTIENFTGLTHEIESYYENEKKNFQQEICLLEIKMDLNSKEKIDILIVKLEKKKKKLKQLFLKKKNILIH